MSRVRGVFPLFLATTFGIVNGIWVFGPAFKDQQTEREEQALKAKGAMDVLNEEDESKTIRDAEAMVSRTIATKTTLKAAGQSSTWWPNMSIWSRGVTEKPPSRTSPAESTEDVAPKQEK